MACRFFFFFGDFYSENPILTSVDPAAQLFARLIEAAELCFSETRTD